MTILKSMLDAPRDGTPILALLRWETDKGRVYAREWKEIRWDSKGKKLWLAGPALHWCSGYEPPGDGGYQYIGEDHFDGWIEAPEKPGRSP